MRRRLAYILLTAALIVGGAATIGSCITDLDTDVTYGAGRDLYFKVLKKDSTDSKLTGVSPDAYYGNEDTGATTQMLDAVAEEFEYRLENWGANATVTKQGTDTLIVSVRGTSDDDTEYNYLANYLPFSGGNISIGVGAGDKETEENAPHYDCYETLFDGYEADIRYINNGTIPVVTIEVSEECKGENGKLAELINYCKDNTQAANEEENVEAKDCYLVLWNNKQEADTFAAATATSAEDYDVNMSKRLVFGEAPNQAWYDNDDDDHDYERFQIIPNSTAIKDDKFDESKAGAAYLAAVYYKSLLNASDYGSILGEGQGCEVSYAFNHVITASVEELATAGDWHISPAFNLTMIATLVTLVAAVVIISLFYRMGALAVIANASFTVIGTLMLFGYFSAQFGIGAVVGLALALIASAFGGCYYFAKMKEELYKGRTIKKAHSEAIKKTLWPTIDAGLISIISGICIYGLIPGAFSKMGLMLVIGGFFGLVANLILLRIESWLLANDKNTDGKIAQFYGVDTAKVPNLANGEKQTFFGPLYEKDFSKAKKPMAIVAAVLAVASIAGVSVFSAINGNAYNYANAYADQTAISLEYRVESGTNATLLLATKQQVKDDFFSYIMNGEKSLNAYVDDIILEQGSIYMTDDETQYDVYYFNVTLNKHFDIENEAVFTVNVGGDTNTYSLQGALKQANDELYNTNTIYVQAQNVVTSVGTPSLGTVYVAVAVSLAALLVYFALRFKPSRAVASTLVAAASGVTVAGFFALTRIAVNPVASMGVLTTTIVAFLLSLFIFNKEKELAADSHEKDKSSREFGIACLKEGSKQASGDMLVMSLLIAFVAILYYGLGPSTFSSAFLGMAVGLVVLVAFITTLLVPACELFSKWFMILKNSLKRTKKETKAKENIGRRKGAEPEEAIIIGIND